MDVASKEGHIYLYTHLATCILPLGREWCGWGRRGGWSAVKSVGVFCCWGVVGGVGWPAVEGLGAFSARERVGLGEKGVAG